MKVIGIDVAPGKGGHICDGSSVHPANPAELDRYLRDLSDNVLIAWDAPLTGPPDPNAWTDCNHDLTTRQIERFFLQSGPYKAPKGISVLSYCSCSHWTITRRLLGLPRVGPYDIERGLPFKLVTDDECRPSGGRHVVEVHPAMALWRWCSADSFPGPWGYKKKGKECRGALCKLMSRRMNRDLTNATDDELDAWIAWYLADRWLDPNSEVKLLGNSKIGSFLMPHEPEMVRCLASYLEHSAIGNVV